MAFVVFGNKNEYFDFGKLKKLAVLLTVAVSWIGFTTVAPANTSHPLENPQPDPLLPPSSSDRPLSAFEVGRIQREIADLNRQAEARLAAGNSDGAFKLWYRELRLQRALGDLAEIAALGRIGNVAWQQNRGFDTRAIAERLAEIYAQAAAADRLTLPLLQELGMAYRQVRYIDRAIDIYRQILTNYNQSDTAAKIENLQALGELYLDLFDYTKAARIYEKLLAVSERDAAETVYLTKLATIYERSSQTPQAIAIKNRLAAKYLETQNFEELAEIYSAIARNYRQLNNSKRAINYYRQAYDLAINSQQLALAVDVLNELARLYRHEQKLNEAIATYQQQIKLQKQAFDYYGWMETCAQLGEIYRDLQNYSRAKTYYQQGLKLAKSLNYRVDYFTQAIEQIESN